MKYEKMIKKELIEQLNDIDGEIKFMKSIEVKYVCYKCFDLDYLDIPFSEMPDSDHLIICIDQQKRLGYKTWALVVARSAPDDGVGPDPICLGWDFYRVEHIAKLLCGR